MTSIVVPALVVSVFLRTLRARDYLGASLVHLLVKHSAEGQRSKCTYWSHNMMAVC